MEGRNPRAALVRTVAFFSRAILLVALLAGGSVVVSVPSRGEDPSTMTSALFEAVERNDLSAVRATVADGARIEARNPFGMRPVDLAIDKGYYEIAHYLLSLHNVREAANAADAEGASARNAPEATEGDTPSYDTTTGLSPQPLPPPPPAVEPPSPPEVLVSSARENELAAPIQPAEPAAPPLPSERDLTPSAPADAEPAKAPSATGDGIRARMSSRIKQAAHSFEETFDTFLGGWFFRWMGRKLAGSDRQDAGDGTVAMADLAISDTPAPAPAHTPAAPPPPAPDSLTASAAEIPLPAASPAAASSPETVKTTVTASVAEKDVPAVEPVAAPVPIASPIAVAPESPLNEASIPSLSTVAVATRKVPDVEPKAATPSRVTSPTPPPAPPLPPSQARRTVDPVPNAIGATDPFAPDAVAPGTRHPVIGEKPPTPPPAPPADRPEATIRDTPSLAASSSAEASAKPAPSGRTSSAQKKAEPATSTTKEAGTPGGAQRPAAAANPTGLLDQLAETPTTAKTASAASKDHPPLGLEGPADAIDAAPGRTAMVSTPAPARKASDSVLTLGQSIYITAAMPPESADPSERNFCVKKNRGAVVFCVEPVDWPAKLSRQLRVNSIMYQGAQAIVRYDNGTATRIYAIFPTETHTALITHYTQRFGKPTATSEHAITPFAQPRQSNKVVSWQRIDPLTHEKTTLEIRRYDDTRGSFPDMRYGAILLYNTASPPIFPVLSTLDLMPTSAQ